MKKIAYLLIVTAMLATSSQAFGQLSGGNDGEVQLPAVQAARSAFYASLNAFQMAQAEANFWRAMQPYHPNAGTAAFYWQISANYQYQALVRLYSVWQGLEDRGYIMPLDRQLALEAKTYSSAAGWYAIGGAAMITSNIVGHPGYIAAADSYNKIELLVREIELLYPEPDFRPSP